MSANFDDDFYQDDLHFRTVTSLLSLFGRTDNTPYDITVPAVSRKNYKLMSVSFLLARCTEMVACLPKQSPQRITLFCTPDLLVGMNPDPVRAEKGFGFRLQAGSDRAFHDTVSYLVENW